MKFHCASALAKYHFSCSTKMMETAKLYKKSV